jgi:hypothetical protein
VFETLSRHLRMKRYANFWDYVRDRENFSDKDLRELAASATDCSLIRPWNPMADQYYVNEKPSGQVLDETVRDLYKTFSSEIWSACFGAGGYSAERGPWGLRCLSGLALSDQVYDQKTLEEFLLRNALKRAAKEVLEERGVTGY